MKATGNVINGAVKNALMINPSKQEVDSMFARAAQANNRDVKGLIHKNNLCIWMTDPGGYPHHMDVIYELELEMEHDIYYLRSYGDRDRLWTSSKPVASNINSLSSVELYEALSLDEIADKTKIATNPASIDEMLAVKKIYPEDLKPVPPYGLWLLSSGAIISVGRMMHLEVLREMVKKNIIPKPEGDLTAGYSHGFDVGAMRVTFGNGILFVEGRRGLNGKQKSTVRELENKYDVKRQVSRR